MAEEVRVYVEEPEGSGVENVYVGLHDNVSKALLQTDMTDADGVAVFPNVNPLLNSGVYEIRVVPAFPSTVTGGKVQNITVLEAPETPNYFDVEITKTGLSTALNTRLCRCSGFFVDASGKALSDVTLIFTENSTPKLEYQSESTFGTKAVIGSRLSAKSDVNGYILIDLYRGSVYEIHMEGVDNVSRTVKIPDLSAANLPDVLFPTVSTVEWYDSDVKILPTESPEIELSLAAGATVLEFKVLLRTGMETESTEVSLSTSDAAVFTVGGASGEVTLTPVAIGEASVTLTRTANVEDEGVISPVPTVIGELTVTVVA